MDAYKPLELEEYEKLISEVYLPDEITVSIQNVKVGEPLTITVKGKVNGNEVTLKNVPVMFGDVVKFTDSSGKVTFTPNKAGTYTITVLDRFGNKKIEKTVKITRNEYNLIVGDKKIGEKITINLPDNGTVKVFKDGQLVTTLTGKTVEYTPNEVGVYKLEYDSNSYYGSTTFKVRGKVNVRLLNSEQSSNTLQNVVYAGDTVTFKFEYDNGKNVDDLNVIVALPATAFGFDKNMAMMMALADPSKFTPPFNINTESKVTNGMLTVAIPEDTEGILILKVPDTDLIEGGTYTFKIENRPFDYTPYIISAVFVVGFGGFAVVVVKNVGGIRDRISSIRTRGGEPPI